MVVIKANNRVASMEDSSLVQYFMQVLGSMLINRGRFGGHTGGAGGVVRGGAGARVTPMHHFTKA